MANQKDTPQAQPSDPQVNYFDLQAYTGATKHMGGWQTTRELIELCSIDAGSYVLDLGCGVGATACLLAQRIGCRVVGVDLREAMVARAQERARSMGVGSRVEFKVGSALDLPFEAARFDVVLCESVATFIEEKQTVVRECARVLVPGGRVGFNEEIWLQAPPPVELVDFVRKVWDVEPPIPQRPDWEGFLEGAGLETLKIVVHRFNPAREATQIQRYGWGELLAGVWRTLALYLRNREFRSYMAGRRRLPRNLFDYLGYGLFVGQKPQADA
jgi:SAM-dependent methyltransferase